MKSTHYEVINTKKIIRNNLFTEIRRVKRTYRLREAQINAVTSYNHLGVIGMAQRGDGCFASLKPPWHTRPDDIITTFKNTILKTHIPCSQFDYLIDRRIKQSGINLFKFEELLQRKAWLQILKYLID